MNDDQIVPSQRAYIEKPGKVQTIAVLTLMNGILNIIYACVATLLIVILTFGIGCLCAPLIILPGILGIAEILYAVKLLPDTPQSIKPNQTLAILEICAILTGNFVSLIIGILNLVFYTDDDVKAYFVEINTY